MSGPWLVKLRCIAHLDRFELVVTDRSNADCRVIPLDDDQLAVLHWEFADALLQRHEFQKRLARQQIPPSLTPHDDISQHPGQHQQAAE